LIKPERKENKMKFNGAIFGWLTGLEEGAQGAAWKSLLILAVAFGVVAAWRRGTASARHLIWTAVFLCLLALPILGRFAPAWHAPAWMVSASLNGRLPESVQFVLKGGAQPSPAPAATGRVNAAGSPSSEPVSPTPAAFQWHTVRWGELLAGLWLVGVLIDLVRILAGQFRLHRLARGMRRCEDPGRLLILEELHADFRLTRPVRLLIASTPTSPLTWGVWRPVVVLPAESAGWPDERLRVVLRHELGHVRRWDCLTQEIARLACAVYWFNPLAWLAARQMRAEREKACDDLVLNAGARPSVYAGHLVEVARHFLADENCRGAVAMARPSGLEQRVAAILDVRRNRNPVGKLTVLTVVLITLGLGILINGCGAGGPAEISSPKSLKLVAEPLAKFVAEKKSQADASTNEAAPGFAPFFTAAEKGDWLAISNAFQGFRTHAGQYEHSGGTDERLRGPRWEAVKEVWGAFEAFNVGEETYSAAFGRDIIQSIPPGSIYFGGTDPGRFIVTALCRSQVDGEPFFVLTQNALADATYLDYLREIYGAKIYVPTGEDSQRCFQEYLRDAQERLKNHKLKPGEDVKAEQGRVQVSGQVAVMEINGLLVKTIFDQNPRREVYVEESFPLEWMYPQLEPHGLIFKLNRQAAAELSDETVRTDHAYWATYVQPMIGKWLDDKTPVAKVAAFAEKTFGRQDFSGFEGDPRFVQNAYAHKMFSKLRSSIGGLYAWRSTHAAGAADRERMAREADFAFRQACALCPYSPEAVFRYVNFLLAQNRIADALLVAKTAANMPPMKGKDGNQVRSLVEQLEKSQKGK
jgi:beta-lactamase regulating signal transducer with metallopeptidase domain